MYEQYTDKQIVEMLVPKLMKAVPEISWDTIKANPDSHSVTNKMIATIYRSAYIRGQLGRGFIIGEKQANKKKAKELVNLFEVGDKVKFLGLNIEDEEALNNRRFFPPVNTVGKVVELGSNYCFVQWSKGTTADEGVWACRNNYLEKVIEHWVPATRDNVKVGDKVRMIDDKGHRSKPWRFPDIGTVGTVTEVGFHIHLVQWPEGSTSRTDEWDCDDTRLEVLLCE